MFMVIKEREVLKCLKHKGSNLYAMYATLLWCVKDVNANYIPVLRICCWLVDYWRTCGPMYGCLSGHTHNCGNIPADTFSSEQKENTKILHFDWREMGCYWHPHDNRPLRSPVPVTFSVWGSERLDLTGQYNL